MVSFDEALQDTSKRETEDPYFFLLQRMGYHYRAAPLAAVLKHGIFRTVNKNSFEV